jgi:hypothetical protein
MAQPRSVDRSALRANSDATCQAWERALARRTPRRPHPTNHRTYLYTEKNSEASVSLPQLAESERRIAQFDTRPSPSFLRLCHLSDVRRNRFKADSRRPLDWQNGSRPDVETTAMLSSEGRLSWWRGAVLRDGLHSAIRKTDDTG